MTKLNVKRIRGELSQSQFADLLGISVRTLQDWEQGRHAPNAAAVALLKLADHGVLMLNTPSIQDIEKAINRMPDGAPKQQKLREVKALREAKAAHQKVAALIRKTGKPKAM